MTTQTQIQVFDFETHPVRVRPDEHGNPWWVAADVCRVLQIANPRDAVRTLDADEKNTVVIADGNPGNPNATAVNESGLYALIFKSRKPQARRFRKWVTSEVLPAIRETGSYAVAELKGRVKKLEEVARVSVLRLAVEMDRVEILEAEIKALPSPDAYMTLREYCLRNRVYDDCGHILRGKYLRAQGRFVSMISAEKGVPVRKEKVGHGPCVANLYRSDVLNEWAVLFGVLTLGSKRYLGKLRKAVSQ